MFVRHQERYIYLFGVCLLLASKTECQINCNSTSCLVGEKKCFFSDDHLILDCWFDDTTGNETNLTAVVTVSNSSWTEIFYFAPVTKDGLQQTISVLWHIDIPRPQITRMNDPWLSKEQWLLSVNVSVEEKDFITVMSLLDIQSEPVLLRSFGADVRPASVACEQCVWLISTSPCAPDVIIASSLISPGRLGIKITYTAFLGNVTYNFLMDLCQYIRNCTNLRLLDVVVTNKHVLVLTSSGILISNNMGLVADDRINSSKPALDWIVLEDVFGCPALSMGKIKYTKLCLYDLHYSPFVDVLYVIFKCDTGFHQMTQAVVGKDPFLQWSAVKVVNSSPDPHILDVLYNVHLNKTVILYRAKGEARLQVQTENENGTLRLMFKEYRFGSKFNITHIEMEPFSHVLFAFGEQILRSYDGGNNFHVMHLLSEGQSMDYMIFDPHGNKYFLHSRNGSLLFGMIGANRLITCSGMYVKSTIIIDFLGNVIIIKLTSRQASHILDISAVTEMWSELVRQVFVPAHTSPSSVTVYELKDEASRSRIGMNDIGRVMSYSGGGSVIIQDVKLLVSHPHFTKAISGYILEPFVVDTRRFTGNGLLKVNVQDFRVRLEIETGWSASDVGRCVIIPSMGSILITAINSSTVVTGISPLKLNINKTIPGTHWAMLNKTGMAYWIIREDVCRHEFSAIQRGSVTIMDIYENVTLSAEVRISAPQQVITSGTLYISMSNPSLVHSRQHNIFNVESNLRTVSIILIKTDQRQGVLSIRMWSDGTSLRCPKAAILYNVYLTCPCGKHLLYIRPKQLNMSEYLYGHPTDSNGPLLFDLPKNYRPPSDFGISIPTSDNIYNADPAVPRTNERFKISMNTGRYKQCLGKSSREQCNCTPEMMYSDDAKFSDCKQRVLRIRSTGLLRPQFVIKHPARGQSFEDGNIYLIRISEVNNRSLDVSCNLDTYLLRAVSSGNEYIGEKWCIPKSVEIATKQTGLFHFKAEVHPGFSFCDLQSEFQVYVDQTFLPYPVPQMVHYGMAFLLGGVLFLIYILYTHCYRDQIVLPSY